MPAPIDPGPPTPRQGVILLVTEDNRGELTELTTRFEAMGLDVFLEDEATYLARGRVADCDCQLLQCVCVVARTHAKACRYRFALTCAVPFTCDEHGRDACPICDRCTCPPEAP